MKSTGLFDATGTGPNAGVIGDAIIAWLPFLVVFVSVPLAIFVPNLVEFSYDLGVVAPFLALAVASFLALAVLWVLKPRWRRGSSLGLFYFGVFFLLSDIVAPLRWNVLDETNIPEPWKQTFLEFFLMLVLVICWDRLPARLVKAFGVPLVLVLLTFHLFDLFVGWQESSDYSERESRTTVGESMPGQGLAGRRPGNVYHFVFDAYSGPLFLDAVRQTDLAAEFDGFTYFRNTLSNYESTHTSVPSFLVGRSYSDGSFRDWQQEAKHGGLRRRLQDQGYEISVYSPERTRPWMYSHADYVRTTHELSHSNFRGAAELRLAQMSLIRLVPSNARRQTYALTNHLFGNLLGWHLSVPLVRQFLADEQERGESGNYVYVHLLLPHDPYVWDSTCAYTGSTDYGEQTLCVTKLMGEIVEELKALGRYEDALIIFQSDHGTQTPDAGAPDPMFAPAQDILDKVHPMVWPVYDAEGYFRRVHALLAIKPPFADSGGLQVSRVAAQLLDVPATVYDLLGLELPPTDGRSVFELEASEPREIHLYPGTFTMMSRAGDAALGEAPSSPSLAHISFMQGRGWRAYPDLPVGLE